MKKIIIAVFCLIGLMFAVTSAQATTSIYIGDADYIGAITPNNPADPSDEDTYVTYLIGLAAGAPTSSDGYYMMGYYWVWDTVTNEWYTRNASTFGGTLPDPVNFYQITTTGEDNDFVSPISGTMYVLGKYDAGSAGSLVWLVDVTQNETYQLPSTFMGKDISHITIGAVSTVPEPTTMLLLGFGLVGLAGVGRKFKK